MDRAALDWIFFADTLNFSFWSADETKKYKVVYKGKEHTGYWSLCAAMNRALDEGTLLRLNAGKGPFTKSGQRKPTSVCAFAQPDQDLRCPLRQSMDAVRYIDEE